MSKAQEIWTKSFEEQIEKHAFNTAPVESVIRNVSYYLRSRYALSEYRNLNFLEMGCGGAINLIWLAKQGIHVSGVDISDVVLDLAKQQLEIAGCSDQIAALKQESVANVSFADNSFEGVIESCVYQHVDQAERQQTFDETHRVLKPGGLFCGHMLDVNTTVYQDIKDKHGERDTYDLNDGGSSIHLQNVGTTHFFTRPELEELLKAFTTVDVSLISYDLPKEEAKRRGYESYHQSMWAVYAIK